MPPRTTAPDAIILSNATADILQETNKITVLSYWVRLELKKLSFHFNFVFDTLFCAEVLGEFMPVSKCSFRKLNIIQNN